MKWTLNLLQAEALKYETRFSFQKGSRGAYRSAISKDILDQICTHMHKAQNSWPKNIVELEALKYKTRNEFLKGSCGAYRAAHRMNIIDSVCSHMVDGCIYWTDEMLKLEALKYKTLKELRYSNESAYNLIRRRGFFDQFCSHMEQNYIHWTPETLQKEALQYKTRGEFQKNSSASLVASRRGVIDQICKHMKLSRSSSIAENELLCIIKNIYPESKKMRDMKVSIIDRPHIKGFEIDIFVQELNKGIEFDGTRYHSFEFMRKDSHKSEWSDEDILNYHKIKDDWFASKGIQILHIKEEDWIKDKEICISRCLNFLGTSHGF
jgi:hypothetical protein